MCTLPKHPHSWYSCQLVAILKVFLDTFLSNNMCSQCIPTHYVIRHALPMHCQSCCLSCHLVVILKEFLDTFLWNSACYQCIPMSTLPSGMHCQCIAKAVISQLVLVLKAFPQTHYLTTCACYQRMLFMSDCAHSQRIPTATILVKFQHALVHQAFPQADQNLAFCNIETRCWCFLSIFDRCDLPIFVTRPLFLNWTPTIKLFTVVIIAPATSILF